MRITVFTSALVLVLVVASLAPSAEPTRVLIIEGQNNHGIWPKTSKMMKGYLEQTKLFEVEIVRTIAKGTDPDFKPRFSDYGVVISNYNGAAWPKETQQAFVEYVRGGGGFVVVHAANNAFGNWKEYNEIIGLGGWGGRNEKSGPYVYINAEGKLVRDESAGRGGHHGSQHPFAMITRDSEHPITRGMPSQWMHAQDELYDLLRGPAHNMHVLATAFASKEKGGTGRHEPMIFTVEFGKGRVLHTPMGHGDYSQECVGFIATLQRGAEWAATGKVTQKLPADFPTADEVSKRKYEEK
jgi:type 1 glutamine amidotransferase